MRESAHTKARRLLVEGRVRVVQVSDDEGYVAAEVRGDSARVYGVGYEIGEGWRCDCPTFGVCSHVRAVQLVVIVRQGPS